MDKALGLCCCVFTIIGMLSNSETGSWPTPIPRPTSTPRPTAGPTPTAIGNVTYDDLARYPDQYRDVYLELTGQVGQIVHQSSSSVELRAYITRSDYQWEDDVYLFYSGDLPFRLLEDDVIRFYALGRGIMEYETVLGASRTIPKLEIVQIAEIFKRDSE